MLERGAPLVVAYGMGVDSTAMLVGFVERSIRPDLILFADTGSEKPETYAYQKIIDAYLREHDFPAIRTVKYVVQRPKHGPYATLEENCLVNKTLPSLAFGYKKCSLKWKRQPQDKFCKSWEPAQVAWARGLKVVKCIGYDAGPKDSKRGWNITDDAEYVYWYPLRDWGWHREDCENAIHLAGLSVPMKSACFFCPASKPAEIDWLVAEHPDLADRIVAMERIAAPNLTKIEGLWRRATKKRPGSMSAYIQEKRK